MRLLHNLDEVLEKFVSRERQIKYDSNIRIDPTGAFERVLGEVRTSERVDCCTRAIKQI